jgi:hypothetical protein
MNCKSCMLALLAGLTMATTTLAETIVITEPKVRTIVTDAGYGEPTLVVQEGDYWRVVSTPKNSQENVTLFVNGEGEIVGAADVTRTLITATPVTTETVVELENPLTESSVTTIVMEAGFHNVHDIDYLDGKGVWKAEADDISGEDYELHVSADTGSIVHIEDD